MTDSRQTRAFGVMSGDLRVWSVASVFQLDWQWESEVVRPLATALKRRIVEVKRSKDAESPYPLVRLKFDGSMELRNIEDAAAIKGQLFLAQPGDVIFSKIDVRNGAIGVVPNEIGNIAVTSEFPVYRVVPDIAIPEYVQLVFRTPLFRRAINSMKSGHSGRKRVLPSDLEAIKVPLPDLDTQASIVGLQCLGGKRMLEAKKRLQSVVNDLDEELWRLYRASTNADVLTERVLALPSTLVNEWDVMSARATAFRAANPSFVPLREFAEEVRESVDPRLSPDAAWPVFGVNNKTGVFFSHMQKGRDFNTSYRRIRKDWFFHNPTRSSVGSLGIVPDVPPDAITSPEYQVWRVKGGLVPGFVAVLISTGFFLRLVQFHRVGAVKQRLYVDNLLSIPIPVILIEEQERIAEARHAALEELSAAAISAAELGKRVDAIIVGTESIGISPS